MISGGIDLGGTKIEARLFGPDLETLDMRRTATPTQDFAGFIAGLADQVRWLEDRSGAGKALPVGVGLPGLVDPQTGQAFAANIPVSGHDLPGALADALGRPVPLINDCLAFALSEAHSGAGAGARSVIGLIMGTGIGAGHALDGALPHRRNGSALEVGHIGLPAHALLAHDLPLRDCGCGRRGCYEAYVSGPGLAWLAAQWLGEPVAAPELARRAAEGDAGATAALELWATLAGELLLALQLSHDPDCIVLGGGLSQMPGVEDRLAAALDRTRLGTMRPPVIRIARHGDSSGARGAALHARAQLTSGNTR
ncbi:ROK family protein (plasmid) [Salipiger sp. H15]|uniref:N-acetylglucosamine kinase n=1 Tax=Alloyangia sp. H15 TaxID=3029062 RepID=A0AAU8AT91_9RHOB